MDSCDENDEVEFSHEDYHYEDLITLKEWEGFLFIDSKNKTTSFRTVKIKYKNSA
ncbi:MAG: hypothetical protein K9J30_06205 [Bacteroidales bacterium]|nr:hypothetical protein [Bacteroidales bacterium]